MSSVDARRGFLKSLKIVSVLLSIIALASSGKGIALSKLRLRYLIVWHTSSANIAKTGFQLLFLIHPGNT